jgi:hypothetical protein
LACNIGKVAWVALEPRPGRPPKIVDPIDIHYQPLTREMYLTLQHLALAA